MPLIDCPECGAKISNQAVACPQCGHPMRSLPVAYGIRRLLWGYEWKTKSEIAGLPLVHIAIGRNRETGKLLVAKGIIAIGQFALGLITIAQFGVGLLFGFGQFVGGFIAIGQFAFGIHFGLGQFATGITAIGQFAFGKYVLAQLGYGKHVWSTRMGDPEAVEHFQHLWQSLKGLLGR